MNEVDKIDVDTTLRDDLIFKNNLDKDNAYANRARNQNIPPTMQGGQAGRTSLPMSAKPCPISVSGRKTGNASKKYPSSTFDRGMTQVNALSLAGKSNHRNENSSQLLNSNMVSCFLLYLFIYENAANIAYLH